MSEISGNGHESAPALQEQGQSRPAPAATRHYILATAGHVDHGKSALVEALTGTNPDRLPEEKARGITIDLGFAHLRLATAGVPATTLELGIIDVPGHEDFVKNMVAGAGAVDLALLAVAAADGWMPQTEDHLQILAYLGVVRAVVALTQLRSALAVQIPVPETVEQALGALLQAGFVQTGSVIRRAAHQPSLPPHLRAPGARLRNLLAAHPLEPPPEKNWPPTAQRRKHSAFCCKPEKRSNSARTWCSGPPIWRAPPN